MTEDVVNKICRQIARVCCGGLKCELEPTWTPTKSSALEMCAVPVFKVHCDVLAYDMSDRTVSHIFGGRGRE